MREKTAFKRKTKLKFILIKMQTKRKNYKKVEIILKIYYTFNK